MSDYDPETVSKCENCHQHTDTRLLVNLNRSYSKRHKLHGKEQAYICFDCCKSFFLDCIGSYWRRIVVYVQNNKLYNRGKQYGK